MDRPIESATRASNYSRYIVGLLLVISIIAYADRLVFGLVIDRIKGDLAISDTQLGLLSGMAFSFFFATMGLPLGRAVDVLPRNVVLAACIGFWSACTMISGTAGSFLLLFLARCGIGAGEAAMNPSAISIISDRFPRERVVPALSVYSIGVVSGGGVAILAGGQLINFFTALGPVNILGFEHIAVWRLVFFAIALPGILGALLVLLTIRDPGRSLKRGRQSHGESRESTLEAIKFIWSQRRVYGLLLGGLIAFGFYNYSVIAWYPTMFSRSYGVSVGKISLFYGIGYMIAGLLGAALVAPVTRVFNRYTKGDAPVFVLLLTSIVALVPAVMGPLMPSFELAVACFLVSMCMSAAQTSMAFSSLVLITPGHRRGLVVATYVATMNLTGGAFGGVIVGLLSDHVFGAENLRKSISLVAVVAVPISILCLAFLRKSYRQAANLEAGRSAAG